jgi:Receptor family ligand binding region
MGLNYFSSMFYVFQISVTKRIEYGNVFQASQNVCKLMKNGVSGIIHGPTSPEAAVHVQNICDTKEMPLIETRFDHLTQQPILNLHPHSEVLAKMFLDIVEAWEWDSFTIIYESAPW